MHPFATAIACATCHSTDPVANRDASGRDVSPYQLWQASLMANAVRDPLWRAEVSVEIAATPSLAAAIEAKCLSCHAPMAQVDALAHAEPLELGLLERDEPRSQLALDGVSCTACHQLEPAADVSATFNGQFSVAGQRELYGPHANPRGSPMSIALNYLPRESAHVTRADLCASCHTLTTAAVDAQGQPTGGQLPEQSPFLEWQNSAFNDQVAQPGPDAASCQACHLPRADVDGAPIQTQIAEAGLQTPVRQSLGRHVFLGGNTLVPQILRDQAADLQPLAPAAAFDALIAATRDQLARRTARVTLGQGIRTGDLLQLPVTVENLSGHKFPTGHPVRRAWLRLTVTDAQGRVVFASGEHDAEGRIVAGGAPLPSERAGGPVLPHYAAITAPDEVQVYQSLMHDRDGDPTFLLLRGEGYLKDNRLLPRGWSPSGPWAATTAPRGVVGDGDFVGGSDTVQYRVRAPRAAGPYTVEATLLYQPLSARFAAELFAYRTPEVEAFAAYYAAADRTPERVAQVRAQVN
ncbi:MAG: multiheme c-type cytochrome [Planctomycetota bacterium]